MIVADCSAVVHVFAADVLDEALADRFAAEDVHAPHLLDVELLHALRGLVIGQRITRDRAEHARHLYAATSLTRYPVAALADRIWSLRHNFTAYDAAYVALAEVLECPLVTRDATLACPGHQADVALYAPPGSVG